MGARRVPLPEASGPSPTADSGGNPPSRSISVKRKLARESELVGDIGEAFVHEWLGHVLGENYGPECWRSKARGRYGLPESGDDALGCDFEISDVAGKLFPQKPARVLIEVKATSTDGSGPFPMSRPEWDMARRCHEDGGPLYVIVRVFHADTVPCIGDALMDPFAAYRRGEVRLADRDLWVTVSPPNGAG